MFVTTPDLKYHCQAKRQMLSECVRVLPMRRPKAGALSRTKTQDRQGHGAAQTKGASVQKGTGN